MDGPFFELRRKPESNKKRVFSGLLATFIVIGIVLLVASSSGYSPSSHLKQMTYRQFEIEDEEFERFIQKHNKHYGTQLEYQTRFKIYRDNTAYIRVFNQRPLTYKLGVNTFADLTPTEFKQLYTPNQYGKTTLHTAGTLEYSYPKDIDWREKGAVSSVKNQGDCGSCWSFSACGAIEGAWFLAKKELYNLSEQELVDCSQPYGNHGCLGGTMTQAFEYVMQKGLTTSAIYPYAAEEKFCDDSKVAQGVVSLDRYHKVTPENNEALLTAVAKQPVSVAVEANQEVWQFYYGGIVNSNCGNHLDHGVLIVGYDIGNEPPYWIVKNSWGAGWGANGYILIGVQEGDGVCGINLSPSYPIIE